MKKPDLKKWSHKQLYFRKGLFTNEIKFDKFGPEYRFPKFQTTSSGSFINHVDLDMAGGEGVCQMYKLIHKFLSKVRFS